MRNIYSLYIFVFIFSSASFNAQSNSFDQISKKIEQDLIYHRYKDALKEINAIILEEKPRFSEREISILRVYKTDALNQANLENETIEVSNRISNLDLLPKELLVNLYLQRALAYEILGKFNESFQELNKAKSLFRQYPEIKPKYYAEYLIRLSSWSRVQRKNENYIDHAIQARDYADSVKNYRSKGVASMLIGFFYHHRDLQRTVYYYNSALDAYKKYSDEQGVAFMYINFADLYIENNKLSFAAKYLDSAKTIINGKKIASAELEFYDSKINYFNKLGKKDSTIASYKKYVELNRLKYESEQKVKIDEIDLKYALEKRKLKNDELQKDKSNLTKSLIAVSSLLFLLALTLWLIFKNREKIRKQRNIITQNNKELEENLKQKEFFVQELNHRVKNNLAVILSLVDFQADETESEFHKQKLQQLHQRINTIAMAHELYAYNVNNFTKNSIEIKTYAENIFETKLKAHHRKTEYINNCEDFLLNVDIALPFGLLLNELITNSLKHAKPLQDPLVLKLTVRKLHDTISMIYEDNGETFYERTNPESLGTFIIENMVKQMNATFTRQNSTYQITIYNDRK